MLVSLQLLVRDAAPAMIDWRWLVYMAENAYRTKLEGSSSSIEIVSLIKHTIVVLHFYARTLSGGITCFALQAQNEFSRGFLNNSSFAENNALSVQRHRRSFLIFGDFLTAMVLHLRSFSTRPLVILHVLPDLGVESQGIGNELG